MLARDQMPRLFEDRVRFFQTRVAAISIDHCSMLVQAVKIFCMSSFSNAAASAGNIRSNSPSHQTDSVPVLGWRQRRVALSEPRLACPLVAPRLARPMAITKKRVLNTLEP